jgi:hypothetical protein
MKISRRDIGATRAAAVIVGAFVILVIGLIMAWIMPVHEIYYFDVADNPETIGKPINKITHINTPEPLKAVYMTACTASNKSSRDKVLSIAANTEINAIVVDVKDYTGTIAYSSTTVKLPNLPVGRNALLAQKWRGGCEIYDLPRFIQELHDKGIYAIARITVFQDPLYAVNNPSAAVKKKSNPDAIWKDNKGLAYIDPGATQYWDYIADIAEEVYDIGFDELNFDYVRFPSDGDLSDIIYPFSEGQPKDEVLRSFFLYLRKSLASTTAPLSIDLFGLTTSAEGDLGIGQKLEDALAYFDYVSPMVYPSHFAYDFNGYPKPAMKPYEVVKYSMDQAVIKALAASSTPEKLRPWLQAFDLGAVYTPAMVRAEIQATYDSGLTSWMLWNAGNIYDKEALMPVNMSTNTDI